MAPVSKVTTKQKRSSMQKKQNTITGLDDNNSNNSPNDFVVETSSAITVSSIQQSSSSTVNKEISSSFDQHTVLLSSNEQTVLSLNSQTSLSNPQTSTSSSDSSDLNPSSSAPATQVTDISIDNVGENNSRKESQVWKYAVRNDDNVTATCKICNNIVKTKNWSTTGLRKHLTQVHQIPLEISKSKTEKSKISNSLKKELHTLAINAIIQDSRSFDDLRRPGILNFLRKAIPGKYINCR